jgi:signal transduction histidine kinase
MEPTTDFILPGLIHDLNNVFQTLMEAADLISEDPAWSAVSAAIHRSIERGREIARSLQSAGQPAESVETILRRAVSFAQDSLAVRGGPAVEFELEVEAGLILRRSWAWERVVMNLLWNSLRAMPDGGAVTLSARRRNRCIEITVADNGCGIDSALLPRIFDPHISTKDAGGLGLHIVRTIVREEGGEIRAENRPGGGAQFTISVPVQTFETEAAAHGSHQTG